jgi:type IV secretory pathway VirB2 component (pilin)
MSRREVGPAPREVIVAIAKGLRATRPKDPAKYTQWVKDCAVVAGVLKTFNAAFLRERFFADCGITEEESK